MSIQTEFIHQISGYAQQDMQRTGILASLTIAQAILESGWGRYTIKDANNLFGYKGKYNGQSVMSPTKEYVKGKWIEIVAEFRKYPSWLESIADHSRLLTSNSRYKAVVGEKDYKKACIAVHKAGYATAPNYSASLINLIEQYKLYEFDGQATKPTPQPQPVAQQKAITVGSRVRVKQGAKDMNTHGTLASFVYSGVYLVRSVLGQRVVIAPAMTGAVTAAINIKDLEAL